MTDQIRSVETGRGEVLLKFNIFVKPSGPRTEVRVNCLFKTHAGAECLSKGIIEDRVLAGVKSRLGS